MTADRKTAISAQANENTADSTQGQVQTSHAKDRKKYSGNHVLRIINALRAAKRDMERECYSMNGIVHIAQEEIEDLMQDNKCSYADIARIFSDNESPVSERTLKDYLARARKDAREGRTGYNKVRQLILEAGGEQGGSDFPKDFQNACKEDCQEDIQEDFQADSPADSHPQQDCPDAARAFSAGHKGEQADRKQAETVLPDTGQAGQADGFDDFASPDDDWLTATISRTMDANDDRDEANKKAQHIQDFYAARKRRKKARNDARRK